MEAYKRAFKSISTVTLYSIANFVVVILSQAWLASIFGAGKEVDAYLLAIALPVAIVSILISASEVVFVPFFKDLEVKKQTELARPLENKIFNFFLFSLSLISIAAIIFSSNLIKSLAPGFSEPSRRLASGLFRIAVPTVLFGGLSSFLMSIYHSREKFALPAFSLVFNNLILIAIFLLFHKMIGVNSLALGMFCGSIGQFILLLPILYKDRRFALDLRFNNPSLYKVGGRFLEMLVGAGFVSLMIPAERLLASGLPEGSISYLGYASRIINLILVLPTAAIPVILLPNLSMYFSTNNIAKLRHNLALGIRFVFFIMFPVSILLYVFRNELVYILLERGNFNHLATQGVSIALVCYIGVLLSMSVAGVAGRGFFAIQNTRLPLLIMFLSFIFYWFSAYQLSRLFSFAGLALALSITVTFGVLVDLFCLRYLLKGLEGKSILRSFSKVILSSLIMAFSASFLYKSFLSLSFLSSNKISIMLFILISSSAGLLLYAILCFIFKQEEFFIILSILFGGNFKKENGQYKLIAEDSQIREKVQGLYGGKDVWYIDSSPVYACYHREEAEFKRLSVPKKGNLLLEIGAGRGRILRHFKNDFNKIVAVDISEKMISELKENCRKNNISNICIVIADAEHLPFKEHVFDVVIAPEVIGHCINPGQLVSEIIRLKKEKSVCVLSTAANYLSIPGFAAQVKSIYNCFFKHKRLTEIRKNIGLYISNPRKFWLFQQGYTRDTYFGIKKVLKSKKRNIASVSGAGILPTFLGIRFKGMEKLSLFFPFKFFSRVIIVAFN